jgi:ketosteroid isomerase-like protein
MSKENVEVVRQALESFKRGDLDAALEFADDDVILGPPRVGRSAPIMESLRARS